MKKHKHFKNTYNDLPRIIANSRLERKKILIRDNWECQKCFNNSIISNNNVGLFETKNKKMYAVTKRILNYNENNTFGGMVGDYVVPFLNSNLVAYFNHVNGYLNIIGLRNFCLEELNLIKHKDDVIQRYALKRLEKIQNRSFQNTEQINNEEENRKERLEEFILNTNKIYKQLSIKSIEKYKWVYSRLDIHHKYYQDGCLPWDYPNEALVAFCRICHETHHRSKEIVHYDKSRRDIGKLNPCPKCSGLGYLQQYNHVEN